MGTAVSIGLLALFGAGAERDARAQGAPTVTVNPLVTRTNGDGTSSAIRPQNLNPTGISFADCELNQTLHFSLSLGGFDSSSHLEAWVGGTDCTPNEARTGTTAICWPVNQHIGSATTIGVDVRVQDIVAHQAEPTKPTTYTPADEAACHVQNQSGPVALGVYFLWLAGTGGAATGYGKYDLKADMQGPGAPALTTIGQGDTLLIANWTPVLDTDTAGFTVYCDPPPNGVVPSGATSRDAATNDASLVQPTASCKDGGFADAGFDDGGIDDTGDATPPQPLPPIPLDGGCIPGTETTPQNPSGDGTTCNSSVLVSGGGTTTVDEAGAATTVGGTQVLIDPAYICGTFAGNGTNQATVQGLKNGTTYTIAVAGSDGFGNAGPLSSPLCSTPVPVDDFWKKYRESGGLAGGGFCALQAVGMPVGTSVFAMTGIVSSLALLRRRRRKARVAERRNRDQGGGES